MFFPHFDAVARAASLSKRAIVWTVAGMALVRVSTAFADERVTLQVWPLSVYEDSEGEYHGHCQPLALTVVRNARLGTGRFL